MEVDKLKGCGVVGRRGLDRGLPEEFTLPPNDNRPPVLPIDLVADEGAANLGDRMALGDIGAGR